MYIVRIATAYVSIESFSLKIIGKSVKWVIASFRRPIGIHYGWFVSSFGTRKQFPELHNKIRELWLRLVSIARGVNYCEVGSIVVNIEKHDWYDISVDLKFALRGINKETIWLVYLTLVQLEFQLFRMR